MNGWREKAACIGMTDLFFPGRGGDGGTKAAREICLSCPVFTNCYEYAMYGPQMPFGILAGMSERERRKRRKAVGRNQMTA